MSSYEEDGAYEGALKGRAARGSRSTLKAEKFKHRAKKLKKRHSLSDLTWDSDEERPTTTTEFADPDLQRLYDRGYIEEVVSQLRGGKEAMVYVARAGERWLVAKLYTERSLRSFRNDAEYWTGFWVGDARTQKAMMKGTRAGQEAKQSIWVMREYQMLWRLLEAGLPVPRPAVGPDPVDMHESGSVVLMELIGDGDQPAPRLSDVRLSGDEARSAWDQSVAILGGLAELGLVHGDYSTYNLLWHKGKVWLIDVPQTVEVARSPQAVTLLRRDLDSLATSFRRHGVVADPATLERRLLAAVRSA